MHFHQPTTGHIRQHLYQLTIANFSTKLLRSGSAARFLFPPSPFLNKVILLPATAVMDCITLAMHCKDGMNRQHYAQCFDNDVELSSNRYRYQDKFYSIMNIIICTHVEPPNLLVTILLYFEFTYT